MRRAYILKKLKLIIKESVIKEIDIGEFQEVCFAGTASSHSMRTCKLGDDKYYLKFTGWKEDVSTNPNESLQIGVEYLAYSLYKLFGIKIPTKIHLVHDAARKKLVWPH